MCLKIVWKEDKVVWFFCVENEVICVLGDFYVFFVYWLFCFVYLFGKFGNFYYNKIL